MSLASAPAGKPVRPLPLSFPLKIPQLMVGRPSLAALTDGHGGPPRLALLPDISGMFYKRLQSPNSLRHRREPIQ